MNLRQSEVTEGLKQQNSEVRRELYSTVCRIHIGRESERAVPRLMAYLGPNEKDFLSSSPLFPFPALPSPPPSLPLGVGEAMVASQAGRSAV